MLVPHSLTVKTMTAKVWGAVALALQINGVEVSLMIEWE
jgi:hypothetical protein